MNFLHLYYAIEYYAIEVHILKKEVGSYCFEISWAAIMKNVELR